jgi:hypothetical protein
VPPFILIMVKRLFFALLVITIPVAKIHGQYFNNGQDRASIKWQRIKSLHFEVIFPEGFEKQGEHVTKLLEKSYDFTTFSLNHKPKKISIVLHTETVKSNAFLGWAPSRIEMYTTPHQGIYSQDWLEQLTLHEYRHMVQLSKLESEMPKILRFLFGEQAAALLTAAYLPFWFLEGDAISAETALSTSGRGRQPEFFREMRAQLVDEGRYTYDKAYLGSYRDHVADYYHLGYLMVGGTRKIFNKLVWDSVVHNVAKKPFSFTVFDKGLKKTTGLNKTALYDTVMDYFSGKWIEADKLIDLTPGVQISPHNARYTNYRHVAVLENGDVFAEKTSLSDINRFVLIDSTKDEKIIFTPGYPLKESVSVNKNTVIWSERLPGKRWEHADNTLIRIFDTDTRKREKHVFKSKMFAPVLSPQNDKFVVVESDRNYRFFLTLLSTTNGEVIKKIQLPGNDYFITPSWSENGCEIYTVVLGNNRKGIVKIDIETEEVDTIVPFGNHEINNPREHNGFVYFIGGFTGTGQIYAVNLKNRELFKVIESRFGVSHFDFGNGTIVYSDYTANGYRIMESIYDTSLFEKVNIDEIQEIYPVAEAIAKQEKGRADFSVVDEITYEAEKYPRALNLFNFHSWAPLAIDPYNYSVYPGISLMSQNMLGTAETVLGYRYIWDKNKGELFANYKFMGWYPVIEAEINYGKSKSSYTAITQYLNEDREVVRADTVIKDYSWNETNLKINAHIPLNFSSGKFYRGFYPLVNYQLSNASNPQNAPKEFPVGFYHIVEAGFRAYTIMHASQQDLLPDFGLIIDARYDMTLPGIAHFGNMYALSGTIYLPGLSGNHGLKLYSAYQSKEQADFSFSDKIRFARGHSGNLNDQMFTFTSDYMFPLFYPDMNLGRWVYFKRFKLSLFYDFSYLSGLSSNNGSFTSYNYSLQSAGFELTSDLHFLRFIAPMEIGFRTSYLFNNKADFDFLFSIDFNL